MYARSPLVIGGCLTCLVAVFSLSLPEKSISYMGAVIKSHPSGSEHRLVAQLAPENWLARRGLPRRREGGGTRYTT